MSLPDLAAVLWRQRDLLERLVYRLECEQLLLAAGRTRFLALATGEVEELMAALRVVEVQRAGAADRADPRAGHPRGEQPDADGGRAARRRGRPGGRGDPRRDGVRGVRRPGPQRPAVGSRVDRRRPGAVRPR